MHVTLLLFAIVAFQDGLSGKRIYDTLSPESYSDFIGHFMGAIHDEGIQKELEIIPSQIAEFKDRISTAKEKYKEAYKTAERLYEETKDSKVYDRLQNDMREYVEQIDTVMSDVLLPHQLEQLNRIVLWTMLKSDHAPVVHGSRQMVFRSILVHQVIKELLEIGEAQAGKIEERTNQLQADFAKDMAELHEKYEKQLREELTPAQARKIKNMLGETPPYFYAATGK